MKKFLPFIIAIPLLLVFAMGGGFLAVQFFAPRPAAAGAAMGNDTQSASGNDAGAKAPGPGPMLLVKEHVINLADPGGRYIKFEASIEFKSDNKDFYKASGDDLKKLNDDFTKNMTVKSPIIEDILISTISGKKSGDLVTLDGKEKLKAELKDKLNATLRDPGVVNIYFTEFVMQ
jgi:flagellar FliL protein